MKNLFLSISVLVISSSLQASDRSAIEEDTCRRLDDAFKRCQLAIFGIAGRDVHEAALRGIALAEQEEQKILFSEIARDNIDRVSFNGLATKEFVTINNVEYKLADGMTKEEFAKNMPWQLAVASRCVNGLKRENVEEKDGTYVITYSYASSPLYMNYRQTYKFSVQAPYTFDILLLKRKLQCFDICKALVHTYPALTLRLPDFDSTQYPTIVKTMDEHKDKFDQAFERLLDIYKAKDQSEEKRRLYTIFAWQVFRFKFMIEEGANTLHRSMSEAQSPAVIEKMYNDYQNKIAIIGMRLNSLRMTPPLPEKTSGLGFEEMIKFGTELGW